MARTVRKIKAVTIKAPGGLTLTVHDVSRVFTNGNRTVTVMQGSNIPAKIKGQPFESIRYTYYK
jgi:hypothetical protein